MPEIIVDRVDRDADGVIALGLLQFASWAEEGIMLSFRKRLNDYVYAIEQGVILKEFPVCSGKRFRIRVFCHAPVPRELLQQMDEINRALLRRGIELHLVCIKVDA